MISNLRISQEGLQTGVPFEELAKAFGSKNTTEKADKENTNTENLKPEEGTVLKNTDKILTDKKIAKSDEESITLKNSEMENSPTEMYSHHPQMIDEDVETFTQKLDTLITNFRTESLKEFMKTKRHVLAEQANKIESEQNRCSALISAKQDELEKTKEELLSFTNKFKRASAQVERMTTYLFKFNKRSLVFLYKFVKGWREIRQKKRHNSMVF